ncbi:MAG: glycosyltransferase [Candidatus Tectimicrobiota bacterium]
MTQPLVSFVIPVFNSEQYIARCLLSIRNLPCPETAYEVLIMDNGSTDRTHEIMRGLGFPFQVVPGVNVSTLRNRGAALARGEYVAFVDSDVEISPQWLQGGLDALSDEHMVATGSFLEVPQGATWVQQSWSLHQRSRYLDNTLRQIAWLGSANLLVRRADFCAIAGFNEHLETAEDVDLCYRLGQRGSITHNPVMRAVHWGEAPDLRTFWRKEVWRGLGNWHGVLSHGWRWDELPSLGYPLYMAGVGIFCGLGALTDAWQGHVWLLPWGLLFLSLPAVLLAIRTTRLTRCGKMLPQFFVMYLTYGLARAYSLSKSNLRKRG